MADGSEWKDLFKKNGWLVGNRVVAPDTRNGVLAFVTQLLGGRTGPTITVEFRDGAREIILNKRDTVGDYTEWDENFLTFYVYKEIKAQRRWADVTNARYMK